MFEGIQSVVFYQKEVLCLREYRVLYLAKRRFFLFDGIWSAVFDREGFLFVGI